MVFDAGFGVSVENGTVEQGDPAQYLFGDGRPLVPGAFHEASAENMGPAIDRLPRARLDRSDWPFEGRCELKVRLRLAGHVLWVDPDRVTLADIALWRGRHAVAMWAG